MKFKKIISGILSGGFLLLLLVSCHRPVEQVFRGYALGTTYHIIVQGQGQPVRRHQIEDLIRRLNASLSTYQGNSLISRINQGQILRADSDFIYVFDQAYRIYKETGGLYDPTIGIMVNAWGFGPGRKIPGIAKDSALVDSLMQFVGYDQVFIDDSGYVHKKKPEIFLDFNSIAKGYVIDKIGELLAHKGYENYLVELGGEVLARGRNIKEDRPWTISIDYPQPDSQTGIAEIYLYNRAIATSGNYRKFKTDPLTGRKYVHSINALTGYPAISHLLSASVLAPDCTTADGWATACMVSGPEKAKRYILSHPELDAILIYSDSTGYIQLWNSGVEMVNP